MMRNNIILGFLGFFFGPVFLSACLGGGHKAVVIHFEKIENGQLIIQSSSLKEPVVMREQGSLSVPEGISVSIEAKGDTGYDLSSWDGYNGDGNRIFLTVQEDIILGAAFGKTSYMAALDPPQNGTVSVRPEIEVGKAYPAQTVFTVTAEPDPGYELDSTYYAVRGPWWVNYQESPEGEMSVPLRSDMSLGASFIHSEDLEGFRVIQDVLYGQPGVKPLKYDVYIPSGAEHLPLCIIIHGGGWTSNDEDIMRGMAREIARTGKYVALSIDYRWIGNADGDAVPNGMDDLIADVYGAIAHIVEHAADYGGDPGQIFLTGDSAGGHLSASAATMVERIGEGGFGVQDGVFEILPTYLPEGMGAAAFRDRLAEAIKAVAPSYGVFDRAGLRPSPAFLNRKTSEEELSAVSPIDNIPQKADRSIPHYMVRGTEDPIITDAGVQAYADALLAAHQEAVYVQIEGIGHAFYDWKPDAATKAVFASYGVASIEDMLTFFDQYVP